MGKRKSKAGWPVPRDDMIHALLKESDRGCVLVGAAFLDEQVRTLLIAWYASSNAECRGFMNEVLSETSLFVPYSSAAWVIRKALAIGLIKDTKIGDAIRLLNTLRNDFAHLSHKGDLTPQDVKPIRACLKAYEQNIRTLVDAAKDTPNDRPFSESRAQFVAVVVFLWIHCWKLIENLVTPLVEGLEKFNQSRTS